MPLFGKLRRSGQDKVATPQPALPAINEHEFSLKLSYSAKASDSVRVKGGPGFNDRLVNMLAGYVRGGFEVVEPLPVGMGAATPFIGRVPGSEQWLEYHHMRQPVTLHTLVVLESVDSIDMAFETLVCGLLEGETDTLGYPDYNAIVGGVVTHWDEATGDVIVRAVVGWGGKGARGDTDRNAARVLAGLFNNIAGDPHAIGTVRAERPVAAGPTGGAICSHCGFNSGHERFYCPKCGMRRLRE